MFPLKQAEILTRVIQLVSRENDLFVATTPRLYLRNILSRALDLGFNTSLIMFFLYFSKINAITFKYDTREGRDYRLRSNFNCTDISSMLSRRSKGKIATRTTIKLFYRPVRFYSNSSNLYFSQRIITRVTIKTDEMKDRSLSNLDRNECRTRRWSIQSSAFLYRSLHYVHLTYRCNR